MDDDQRREEADDSNESNIKILLGERDRMTKKSVNNLHGKYGVWSKLQIRNKMSQVDIEACQKQRDKQRGRKKFLNMNCFCQVFKLMIP